jgi:FAD:protein FMN transferase
MVDEMTRTTSRGLGTTAGRGMPEGSRAAVATGGAARDVGPLRCDWRVWGTKVTLAVTAASGLHRARLLLEEEIADIDTACNRFIADSDVSRCNRGAGSWVEVGTTFLDALDVALDAAATTDGAVDPTVGAALVALGYDRDFDELRDWPPRAEVSPMPSPAVGWERVEVDRRRRRVRIPDGASLDLGATAKAWCVDRAVALVAGQGVGVLVDIGGDLAVGGPLPAGGWRIGVQESSRDAPDAVAPVVSVNQGAIASSGTTLRAWTVGDAVVHHIIDPHTGQPAMSQWRMVTVAAPSCVEANVAATAAVVLGQGAAAELERQGRPARLVAADGGVVVVGGWPEDRPTGPRHGAVGRDGGVGQ